MLNLTNAGTDKLQLITSTSGSIDVHVSWMDYNGTSVTPGRTNTAITTATTTDITATPGASSYRNIKSITVRNKHASNSCDVTVVFDQNGTDFELYECTLRAGETLEFIEGVGFFVLSNLNRLDVKLRVSSDVVNATTSFADCTGLTYPVEAGKFYNFDCRLIHQTNATTTGAQFGIGGVAMTSMIISAIQQITSSVTAAAVGASPAVTAVDTAAVVETTGPGANNFLAILTGHFVPSADGTFAIRQKSEVAVASGLTIKTGSWLRLWEAEN